MSDIKTLPFSIAELQSSGLLWAINRYILHDHNLALGVDYDGAVAGQPNRLKIVYGYDSFPPEVNLERRDAFVAWVEAKRAEARS